MPPAVARWSDFLRKHYKTNVFQQKKNLNFWLFASRFAPTWAGLQREHMFARWRARPDFQKLPNNPNNAIIRRYTFSLGLMVFQWFCSSMWSWSQRIWTVFIYFPCVFLFFWNHDFRQNRLLADCSKFKSNYFFQISKNVGKTKRNVWFWPTIEALVNSKSLKNN